MAWKYTRHGKDKCLTVQVFFFQLSYMLVNLVEGARVVVVLEVGPELRGRDHLDGEGHAVVVEGDVLATGEALPVGNELMGDLEKKC